MWRNVGDRNDSRKGGGRVGQDQEKKSEFAAAARRRPCCVFLVEVAGRRRLDSSKSRVVHLTAAARETTWHLGLFGDPGDDGVEVGHVLGGPVA